MNLTKFIHRIKGIECLVARVLFNKDGASIDVSNYEQRAIGVLCLHISCESFDWQINSATQVCSALWRVLSAVEELTLDLDVDGVPSEWENTVDSTVWHGLLLPFVRVKKLRIGSSLTPKLSQSLESVAGGFVLELLPELQELEIHLEMFLSKKLFSSFIEVRESVARPVHLSVHPSMSDIATAASVSRSIYKALSDSMGSSYEYQCLIEELRSFERALIMVDCAIATTHPGGHLIRTIANETTTFLALLNAFLDNIKSYQKALGGGRKGVASWRKIGWGLLKADDVARFREKLSQHKQNINIFRRAWECKSPLHRGLSY